MSYRSRESQRQAGGEPLAAVLHHASRSHGRPLDAATRGDMESHFQHDFTGVRVHTDDRAAATALALNASAYTAGRDIFFAPGRYAPDTSLGRKLLAHELAHVVQQRDSPSEVQACSLAPARDSAELEAHAASAAVTEGRPLPGPLTARTTGTIQRSVLGGIAGAVLGGVAGLAQGDAASVEKRGLTSEEETEARLVFADGLDYGAVKIAFAPIMGIGSTARTPLNTVYFPTWAEQDAGYLPWLIHELTHVWQTQHGISVMTKLFHALQGEKHYDYGGEEGLRQALAQGKHFTDFNTEQQGDILEHYYKRLKAKEDTSIYDPFVVEVQSGGNKRAGTLYDRNTRGAPATRTG